MTQPRAGRRRRPRTRRPRSPARRRWSPGERPSRVAPWPRLRGRRASSTTSPPHEHSNGVRTAAAHTVGRLLGEALDRRRPTGSSRRPPPRRSRGPAVRVPRPRPGTLVTRRAHRVARARRGGRRSCRTRARTARSRAGSRGRPPRCADERRPPELAARSRSVSAVIAGGRSVARATSDADVDAARRRPRLRPAAPCISSAGRREPSAREAEQVVVHEHAVEARGFRGDGDGQHLVDVADERRQREPEAHSAPALTRRRRGRARPRRSRPPGHRARRRRSGPAAGAPRLRGVRGTGLARESSSTSPRPTRPPLTTMISGSRMLASPAKPMAT